MKTGSNVRQSTSHDTKLYIDKQSDSLYYYRLLIYRFLLHKQTSDLLWEETSVMSEAEKHRLSLDWWLWTRFISSVRYDSDNYLRRNEVSEEHTVKHTEHFIHESVAVSQSSSFHTSSFYVESISEDTLDTSSTYEDEGPPASRNCWSWRGRGEYLHTQM